MARVHASIIMMVPVSLLLHRMVTSTAPILQEIKVLNLQNGCFIVESYPQTGVWVIKMPVLGCDCGTIMEPES